MPRRITLLAGVLFAVAYTQSPLFYSNQNQYLLHGVAGTPGSRLADDWLANTLDPTPAFSAVVGAAFQTFLPAALIYLLYGGLLVCYVRFLADLVTRLPFAPATPHGRAAAFALLLFTHAALFRWASVQLTGYDYSWNFQAGVANQYLLGAGLQPSAFGVFLVGSLAAFDPRRPWPAVAAATIACVAHFTYLLPTGLLFVGYLAATGKVKGPTVRLALLMAGCLLPIVAFNAVRFRPTDAATFAEAQRLLVEVRIPHHCRVEKWLDPIAGLQLAWVAAGIFLIRRTPLGRVLAVSAGAAIILSLVAVATGYHLLLLLFPWRVSAVLVPVATAIIATRLAAWVEASLVPRRVVWAAAGTVVVAAVAAGVAFPFLRIGYATNDAVEGPLLAHVREAKRPGDVYLIPTRIPDLAGGKRGSASTTFTPPPRPVPGGNQIAVDLQRFRLATGAPIYVDFKAIPYADVEVLDWYRRVRHAQAWYEDRDWGEPATVRRLRDEGITCVVVAANRPINSPAYQEEYADAAFRVYRLAAQ